MSEIAQTPKVPYYAVIFTSERTDGDNGYSEMSDWYLRYKTRICKVERDYGFEKDLQSNLIDVNDSTMTLTLLTSATQPVQQADYGNEVIINFY